MELFGKNLDLEPLAAPLRGWVDGLRECLASGSAPRHVLRRLAAGELALDDERPLAMEGFLDSRINDDLRRNGVIIDLPAADILVTLLELPLAAADNLTEVLGYEMDRYTPFAAGQVHFDQQIVRRDPAHGRVHVALAVVRRERIDPLLQGLESHGVRVLAVRGEGLWSGGNLLPAGRRPRRGWLRLNRTQLLLLLFVSSLAAALATPLLQARANVVALGEELAGVRSQVGSVLTLRERLEQRHELARAVIEYGIGRPAVVDVLRELTQVLPDDTWLQALDLNGAKLEIQGESARATDLIALLESSPRFQAVSFRAPLVQVRNKDKERFSITLQLAEVARD